MRVLILLTTAFPYGKGEEFLQNELASAKEFDTVYLCPLSPNSSERTKAIPHNAKIISVAGAHASYPSVLCAPAVIGEALRHPTAFRYIHEAVFLYKKALGKADAILKQLDLSNADVTIYSYWLHEPALVGALLKQKLGGRARAISRAHGYDLYEHRSSTGILPYRRYLLKHLDAVYPCSQNGVAHLAKRYPAYKDKVSLAYLGTVDHGIKHGVQKPFHLVSCSYLVPIKRVHLILEALKKVEFPVQWTHLGGGDLLEELQSRAKDLPSHITCTFKGHMNNRDILDFYLQNDVSAFINVSASEGLPVTIMEATSFGLPIIATDVGGSAEIVLDRKNGMLLPADATAEQIAEAIKAIAELPADDYRRYCEVARIHWDTNFCADRNYANFYTSHCGKEQDR